MRLPGPHSFGQLPGVKQPRSRFDRSHGYKTTFDSGELVPVFVDEALPGDTFNVNMTGFARLATPLHPVMDNLYLTVHFWAVPYRLVWLNWERFNGAQDNPDDPTDYLIPQMTETPAELSLSDYFGLPTKVEHTFNSLHHRAYNLIWNEWYRDENLQDSVVVDKDDGPDDPLDYVVLRRGKRKDYFTSALPWPQKGPAVELPLGTLAPVIGTGDPITLEFGASDHNMTSVAASNALNLSTNPATSSLARLSSDPGASGMFADLSDATAATINALRQAFAIQRLYERDARGGTRYTEIIRSHFGVTSPDARLQRPEFLGGGSSRVNIAPVAQTSASETGSPQGNLAAFGTSVARQGFTKSFTEHCLLIGLVSVRADLTYQQGVNRMFRRRTRWDYYWPELSNIGEQAVLNEEIYVAGTSVDAEVFGYQARYDEYRYKPTQVTGLFRSNATASLDTWHLAADFADTPPLNAAFIQDQPDVARVLAVETEPQFLLDSWFNMTCVRPMPMYGVPGAGGKM